MEYLTPVNIAAGAFGVLAFILFCCSFFTIHTMQAGIVVKSKVKEAFYNLDDPEQQIKAHVENVILSYVPKLTLDETYLQETEIADKIKENLTPAMAEFGYAIQNALVTSIIPTEDVVKAMNDINAARREQVAQVARAEAAKLTLIANAEAESRAKVLEGEGIAGQRQLEKTNW